jgi:hypothetical protein
MSHLDYRVFVNTRKKLTRLIFPTAVIAFGVVLVVRKKASYGWAAPEVEGPVVVFVGALFCLLGFWAIVSTLRSISKKEEPLDDSDRTLRDFE